MNYNTPHWNRVRDLERRSQEKESERDWEYYKNRSSAHRYTNFRDYTDMVRRGEVKPPRRK